MAIVIIGGHSRNVGKTSVVAGIIAAFPEHNWSAFKITQYGHGVCSKDGEACHCATDDHSWAISEEKDRSGRTDTSRFLAAGAAQVYWVRTQQGRLAEAMPTIRRRLGESRNAIVESNSLMKFVRPDLYITVLDPATADFKPSAQEFLDRADAVILHHQDKKASWLGTSLKPASGKPVFQIYPPEYVTPQILEFVNSRLKTSPFVGSPRN
jgi:molybdopterin-guanine dinucleotide biosynthesis protein